MEADELKSWFDRFYKEARELFPTNANHNYQLFPRMILKSISHLSLTDEEVEAAIYNLGSDDECVDAFHKDSENNFHVFQFKSKKRLVDKDYIPINNIHSEIDRLVNCIDRLKKDVPVKNHRIHDIKEEIMNNPQSQFFYYYYTQDLMNEAKIVEYEKLNRDKNKDLTVFDLNIISEKYSEYISSFAQQLESLELPIEQCLDIGCTDGKKSYVLILNGYDIYSLMKEKKFQLFKNNVRFYLGDKQSVNKKIIETAKKNPADFFNFNNGITIEATEVIHSSSSKVYLKNPSIINGAQTVNCIHSAYKNLLNAKPINNEDLDLKGKRLEEHFKKIKILTKLTIIDNPQDEYSKSLSKNVNSQNVIKEADYFSNLDEQIQLKRELGISYNLFYEIKRGETTYFRTRKKEVENITQKPFKDFSTNYLKLEDFNRNYIAVFNNPGSSFHSVNNIFKKEDNYYETIIQKGLVKKFNLTIRKMIFSQFLIELVKEEFNLYKKFYNALCDINISNQEKINLLNNTGFLYKDELIENIDDIENFEQNYGSLNFPLLGKGKYVYSYFIRFFIENLKNKKNGVEYFDRIIQSNLIEDYRQFKLIMTPLIYHINELIQPFFEGLIAKGKTENQLTMNANSYLEECEKLINEEIIKINRHKRANEYSVI